MIDIRSQYEKVQIAKFLKANPQISKVNLIHALLTNEGERARFANRICETKGVAAEMLNMSVRTFHRVENRNQETQA